MWLLYLSLDGEDLVFCVVRLTEGLLIDSHRFEIVPPFSLSAKKLVSEINLFSAPISILAKDVRTQAVAGWSTEAPGWMSKESRFDFWYRRNCSLPQNAHTDSETYPVDVGLRRPGREALHSRL